MIKVSDSAKNKITEIHQENKYDKNYFLRVSVLAGGCSGLTYNLDFDNQLKKDDQVYEDQGVKLVTDLKSVLFLFNVVLDYTGGLSGKGFHFNNPNATRTCSCGESFSV